MKTITIDFETYEAERNMEYQKGYRCAVRQFHKIIKEVEKGDYAEGQCILGEILEDCGVTTEEFHQFARGLQLANKVANQSESA